jgi:hypothetical protein
MELVIDPFEVVFPVSVFVDLIEDDERGRRILTNEFFEKKGVFEKARSVLRDIPIKIQVVRE